MKGKNRLLKKGLCAYLGRGGKSSNGQFYSAEARGKGDHFNRKKNGRDRRKKVSSEHQKKGERQQKGTKKKERSGRGGTRCGIVNTEPEVRLLEGKESGEERLAMITTGERTKVNASKKGRKRIGKKKKKREIEFVEFQGEKKKTKTEEGISPQKSGPAVERTNKKRKKDLEKKTGTTLVGGGEGFRDKKGPPSRETQKEKSAINKKDRNEKKIVRASDPVKQKKVRDIKGGDATSFPSKGGKGLGGPVGSTKTKEGGTKKGRT